MATAAAHADARTHALTQSTHTEHTHRAHTQSTHAEHTHVAHTLPPPPRLAAAARHGTTAAAARRRRRHDGGGGTSRRWRRQRRLRRRGAMAAESGAWQCWQRQRTSGGEEDASRAVALCVLERAACAGRYAEGGARYCTLILRAWASPGKNGRGKEGCPGWMRRAGRVCVRYPRPLPPRGVPAPAAARASRKTWKTRRISGRSTSPRREK